MLVKGFLKVRAAVILFFFSQRWLEPQAADSYFRLYIFLKKDIKSDFYKRISACKCDSHLALHSAVWCSLNTAFFYQFYVIERTISLSSCLWRLLGQIFLVLYLYSSDTTPLLNNSTQDRMFETMSVEIEQLLAKVSRFSQRKWQKILRKLLIC